MRSRSRRGRARTQILRVLNDLPNNCGYSVGSDWFADTTFRIGNDGTFDARGAWGEPHRSFPYERGLVAQWDGWIAGRFDTATSVSGTVVMRWDLEQREDAHI